MYDIYICILYNTIVCKTAKKTTRVCLKRGTHREHLYIDMSVNIQLCTYSYAVNGRYMYVCMYRKHQTFIDSRFFALFAKYALTTDVGVAV